MKHLNPNPNPALKPGQFMQYRDEKTGAVTVESGYCIRYGLIELGVIGEITIWASLDLEMGNLNEFLQADAARSLGPGVRFEIRENLPCNYGNTFGRAWYHHPRMAGEAEWPEGVVDGGKQFIPGYGYYLVGKFVTPSQAERLVDRRLDECRPIPEQPRL
jgi:hypothetical protein